jgi:hypothetical protein
LLNRKRAYSAALR